MGMIKYNTPKPPKTPLSAKSLQSLRNLHNYGGSVPANLTDMRKAGFNAHSADALKRRGYVTTVEVNKQYRAWADREIGTMTYVITSKGNRLLTETSPTPWGYRVIYDDISLGVMGRNMAGLREAEFGSYADAYQVAHDVYGTVEHFQISSITIFQGSYLEFREQLKNL